MKEFLKSRKLDNVAYDVRGPVLDEAMALEAAGAKILKLNIGNPGAFGFEAPACIGEEIDRKSTRLNSSHL